MAGNILKNGNAIQVGSLASAPSNPENGTIYYDSTLGKFQQYEAGGWITPVNTANLVASEIAYERADGSKKNIAAGSDEVESALDNLDDAIGALDATPVNYTPVDPAIVADHLAAIDAALATSGVTEFLDSDFEIQDNGDATKVMKFEVSAIATGTIRTITMPDANVNLGLIASAIQSSEKGANNGVATLDAGGKIPLSQLPSTLLTYEGVWNASTNSPTLADGIGDTGMLYRVGTSGSQDLGSGSIDFVAGDYVIYNGSEWEKSDGTDAVTSVNGQQGVVVLTTSHISEGSNLYFTDSRAKTAAVVNSTAGSQTDQAASVSAMKSYVTTELGSKIGSLVEDTSPALGGDLELSTFVVIEGAAGLKRGSSSSDFLEQQYFHSVALSASQTNTVIASFTFAHASYEGFSMEYKVKEATTNRVRIGVFKVVTNGTDIDFTDLYNETASLGLSFDAVVNGANINIRYSKGSNAATLRADVKRIKA